MVKSVPSTYLPPTKVVICNWKGITEQMHDRTAHIQKSCSLTHHGISEVIGMRFAPTRMIVTIPLLHIERRTIELHIPVI